MHCTVLLRQLSLTSSISHHLSLPPTKTKLPGVTVKPTNPFVREHWAVAIINYILVSHETSLSSCFSIYFRDHMPKQASLRSTFWHNSVLNFIPYSYSFQQPSNQPPLHPGKNNHKTHPPNQLSHLHICLFSITQVITPADCRVHLAALTTAALQFT